MYLILLLCVVTSVYGHSTPPTQGGHAGNFMACSPCFSFQGQNILVPGAPQCMGGFGGPWGFNHPFFGGCCNPAMMGGMGGMGCNPIPPAAKPSKEASSPSADMPTPPAIMPVVDAAAPVVDAAASAAAPVVDAAASAAAPVVDAAASAAAPVVVAAAPPAAPVADAAAPIVDAAAPIVDAAAPIVHAAAPVVVAAAPPAAPVVVAAAPVIDASASAAIPAAAPAPAGGVTPLIEEASLSSETPAVISKEIVPADKIEPMKPVIVSGPLKTVNPSVVEEALLSASADPPKEEKPAPPAGGETPQPTLPPTPQPSPEPTMPPTPEPTMPPTPEPTMPPTPEPTMPPTMPPTPEPTAPPTPPPTPEPTTPPTPPPTPTTIPPPPCKPGCGCDASTTKPNQTNCGVCIPQQWDSCDSDFGHYYDDKYPIHDCDLSAAPSDVYHDSIYGYDHLHGCSEANYLPYAYQPYYSQPCYETKVLPPITAFNASILQDMNVNITEIENMLPPGSKIVKDPEELKNCVRHNVVTEVKPVINECITNIPFIKNSIKQKEETFTHHVPIITDTVSTQEEKRLFHIPIVNHRTRDVIEHKTEHIPVTKSRVVPVVETFTRHVPVTRQYCRPVVESSLTSVPVVETSVKPVVHQTISHIPITERRNTPVVHYADNTVEPQSHCAYGQSENLALPPTYLDTVPQESAGYPLSIPHYPKHSEELPNAKFGEEIQHANYQEAYPNQVHYHSNLNVHPTYSQEHSYSENEEARESPYNEEDEYYENDSGYQSPLVSRQSGDDYEEEDGEGYPQESYVGQEPEGSPEQYADGGEYQETFESPKSAPLLHGIPFPEQGRSEEKMCYSKHPDYCD